MTDRLAIPAPRLPDPPDRLDPRMARAAALGTAGDHAAARQLLLEVLTDRPDSALALAMLSESYAATGDHAASAQFAEAGLRIWPDSPMLHRLRAFALTGLKRLEEARAASEIAIAYDPRSFFGYLALVRALRANGTIEGRVGALAVAARAVEVADLDEAERLRLAVVRGTLLGELDLLAEARAEFARVLAADAGHAAALSDAAMTEHSSWHIAAAARHVGTLLAARPTDRALRRQFRVLTRQWLGGVFLGAGVAVAVAAGIRYLTGPAGFLVALASVAGFAWTVAASARRIGRRLPLLLRTAATDPMSAAMAVVAMVLTATALVASVDLDAMGRAPYLGLLFVGLFLAINAVVAGLQMALAAAGRARRRRRLLATGATHAIVNLPPVDPYPVETPATGGLLLALRPLADAAAQRAVDTLVAAGVGTLVSTLRRDTDEQTGLRGPAAAAGIELVAFPVEALRPPAEPEVDLLVDAVVGLVRRGGRVAFACNSAADQSALLAAAVLVRLGLDTGTAWARVTAARGMPLGVSTAQRAWLDAFAARDPAPPTVTSPDAP